MRNPIYKSRPVEPNPAHFGGERINDFIVLSEAFRSKRFHHFRSPPTRGAAK